MISQTVEYALRAIVCLAQNEGHALTTQQVSSLTRMPASYTSKVLQSLARAGLISATRGIGGGYVLSISPAELTALDVVNAIDPLKRITKCPLGLSAHGTHLCPLHHRLDQVLADAEEAFRNTRIAELLKHPSGESPLCEMRPVQIGKKAK